MLLIKNVSGTKKNISELFFQEYVNTYKKHNEGTCI